MRSITEWRKRILIHLSSSKVPKFCSEKSFRELFAEHVDANLRPALDSLVGEGLIYQFSDSGYTINPTKGSDIIAIIMQDGSANNPIQIEHEREFKDYEFWFGTNGTSEKKSNYMYHRGKTNTNCFKVQIAKKGKKVSRIDMGCIDDANSKIGKILTVIKSMDSSAFTKSDIEKKIQHAVGNNRQPIKAAFDILEKLGEIRNIEAGTRHPKYIKAT